MLLPKVICSNGIWCISISKNCATLIAYQQHPDLVPSITMLFAYWYIWILCFIIVLSDDAYSMSNAIVASFSLMACWCFPWISSNLESNPRGTMSFKMCSLSALPLYFREFTMIFMTTKNKWNLSALFCWYSDPRQKDVLCHVGTSYCLVNISHFSKSFNDIQIFSIPKKFSTWARVNQFCSSLPTITSVSLRLN